MTFFAGLVNWDMSRTLGDMSRTLGATARSLGATARSLGDTARSLGDTARSLGVKKTLALCRIIGYYKILI